MNNRIWQLLAVFGLTGLLLVGLSMLTSLPAMAQTPAPTGTVVINDPPLPPCAAEHSKWSAIANNPAGFEFALPTQWGESASPVQVVMAGSEVMVTTSYSSSVTSTLLFQFTGQITQSGASTACSTDGRWLEPDTGDQGQFVWSLDGMVMKGFKYSPPLTTTTGVSPLAIMSFGEIRPKLAPPIPCTSCTLWLVYICGGPLGCPPPTPVSSPPTPPCSGTGPLDNGGSGSVCGGSK